MTKRIKSTQPVKTDLQKMSLSKLQQHVERSRLIAEANTYQALGQSGWGTPTLSELGHPGPGFVLGQPYKMAGDGTTKAEFFKSERDYFGHVSECRWLYRNNPYAKNIVENLTSYIVGGGFSYKVTPKIADDEASKRAAEEVQKWIDEYRKHEQTAIDEQESVRRGERDGEVVVAFYEGDEGKTEYRFRDPGDLRSPTKADGRKGAVDFGVDFKADDAKTVLGYYIDGDRFEPEEVEHVKLNVDFNAPRGTSSLWCVREFLCAAVTSIGFVTRTANFQSSIPLIRRHKAASFAAVQATLAGKADRQVTTPAGEQRNQFDVNGNRVVDASADTEYEFPTSMVDVGKMVEAVQANLRAAASGVIMPEWMVTGKLDGKYSNAEISEGPTGYMINRKQKVYTGLWRCVFMEHLLPGKFDQEVIDKIDLQVIPPQTGQGQTFEEAQVSEVQKRNGVLSTTTWQAHAGLDATIENRQIAEEESRALGIGAPATPNPTGQ